MFDLSKNGEELFFFFLFPIIGLCLDYLISPKRTLYILVFLLVLISPILAGYSYIIPYAYQVLGILILSCVYSYFSRLIEQQRSKVIVPLFLSGVLFTILSFAAFMDAMSGFQKVEKRWKLDHYRIEYIMDQGFAGHPLMKYELSRYSFIPLLVKYMETSVDRDSIDSCIIPFKRSNIQFDECKARIIGNVSQRKE